MDSRTDAISREAVRLIAQTIASAPAVTRLNGVCNMQGQNRMVQVSG